jgi:hypothetical protein
MAFREILGTFWFGLAFHASFELCRCFHVEILSIFFSFFFYSIQY